MTASSFQFSAPAQLYAKHRKIPDIIEEMRQESYRSMAEFRDSLLGALAREVKPARLCRRTTNTTGQYSGADIEYIWLGEDADVDWRAKVGMAAFFCPLPDKVRDEKLWRDSLALIAESVLRLTVLYGGPDKEAQRRIMSLAKRPEFHAEQRKKEFYAFLQLDADDPVGSAAKQVAGLLRAVSDAQQGHR